MAKGKKFEQDGGYSAIGRVFARDAAIDESPAASTRSSVEVVEQAKPVSEQKPVTPKAEPVVELRPEPAPEDKATHTRTRVPASSKRAPKSRPAMPPEPKAVEKPNRRSTRAGGRLPAIRVECMPEEFAEFEALVFNLGRAAGHKLSNNILGRALVRLALEAEEEIRKAVEKHPPRSRPANGNAEELARHEDEWQRVVAEAMRALKVRR